MSFVLSVSLKFKFKWICSCIWGELSLIIIFFLSRATTTCCLFLHEGLSNTWWIHSCWGASRDKQEGMHFQGTTKLYLFICLNFNFFWCFVGNHRANGGTGEARMKSYDLVKGVKVKFGFAFSHFSIWWIGSIIICLPIFCTANLSLVFSEIENPILRLYYHKLYE